MTRSENDRFWSFRRTASTVSLRSGRQFVNLRQFRYFVRVVDANIVPARAPLFWNLREG